MKSMRDSGIKVILIQGLLKIMGEEYTHILDLGFPC